MKSRFRLALAFLTILLYCQGVFCQIPGNMTDYLSRRFKIYCESVPREEIFVQSDRDEYIAGEDLWFMVYLIDRQSFRPSLKSTIAYFELLNSENRPVVQKRILADKGFGPGQVVLPDTLSTGIYIIRAYTSWMKNFLPYNCFLKKITIYNTLNAKAPKVIPAGIYFTGEADRKNIPDNTEHGGLELTLDNSRPDILELIVKSDNKLRVSGNNQIYLIIQTHGNINLVSEEKLSGDTTRITIRKSLLEPGINQVTIFDVRGRPVAERYVYTPGTGNALLNLHSEDHFNVRNKVSLEIELGKDILTGLNSTNISVSVAPRTNSQESIDLNDYILFGSEFGFLPWNIIKGRKINSVPSEEMESILLNLRSNWIDWETILSEAPPRFRYQTEDREHFLLGKLLSGDQKPVGPDELVFLCTPGKNPGFNYARTDKEGNFSFDIHIDEGLKDLILMPADAGKNYRIIIEPSFSDQITLPGIAAENVTKPIPPYIRKWSLNYQVRTIYRISSRGSPFGKGFPPVKSVRFYGQPDVELIMADFIELPVMEEVFHELLPNISLRKKKDNYTISITDWVDDNLYVTSPQLLIDGVIISDASLIINLDPAIVEKIDLVKQKYLVGRYIFSGIINVITKSGDFSCLLLPDYMTRLSYRVSEPVSSFVSPDYSTDEMKNSRIPDYRNTLFWNSSLKPDKQGKARIEFWTSDNSMDYVIDIQGLTQEGKAFSLKKIIEVE